MSNETEQKSNNEETGLHKRLNKDFLVKNMPPLSHLSGASYENRKNQKTKKVNSENIKPVSKDSKQMSYRKMGLIIISSGLVVIIILFYLAYRFLIAPSLKTETEIPVNKVTPPSSEVIIEPETESDNNKEPSENIIEPVEVIEQEIISAEIEEVENNLELPSISDLDEDNLSDVAEAFLGTDINNPDTDADGYSDKEEILNGYNPLGPGLLTDNANLALFVDSDKQYAVIYPQAWEVEVVGSSVLFAAPDQDFIQVSYEDGNKIYASIIDWYEEQFEEVDKLTADRFVLSSFGPGIISADKQFVYFLDNNGSRVFVISYIPSGSALPYLEIFQMMIATFMKV